MHEWLATYAGSEKVVEQILQIWPEADLFAVVDFLGDDQRAFVGGRRAKTTFVQRLPGARRRFRHYLPLMPLAVEQLDLSGYDIVISSNHAVAKGVITGPDQLHVSYVHSPMRYAWDLQHQYLAESGLTSGLKAWVTRALLHYLRNWDARSAAGVDRFVANSRFIARRVRKVYRREAEVVHPPVDIERFVPGPRKDDFYLAASRLVPYKQMPMIAAAFSRMPDKRLVVIGDGPEMAKLRAAAGPNVQVLGFQGDATLVDHMQRARAFVFAAEEDFGIAPVEAQACGTPVIAFGRGGALDTVRVDGPANERTGLFFDAQTPEAVIAAIQAFEALPEPISPQACRRHAESFSQQHFRAAFRALVERHWQAFREEAAMPLPPAPVTLRAVGHDLPVPARRSAPDTITEEAFPQRITQP